jgi:hypothetical protein
MPGEWVLALSNQLASLAAGWPTGTFGAFLLFLLPVGGGIPAGVLMARAGDVTPLVTVLLYFASDVVTAFIYEPLILGAHWLGRRVAFVARLGKELEQLSNKVGLHGGGARGPLSLILVSFAIGMTACRAAAASVGHGFLPGWALAIAGDMLYFLLLMASTLWLTGFIGDDRVTLGIGLLLVWMIPFIAKRQLTPKLGLAPAAESAPVPERRSS